MSKYDDLLKRLGRLRPQDFLHWLCPHLKKIKAVSFEDREFELTYRRVDILYKVTTADVGEFFLHLEFQAELKPGFPLRLQEYSARIRREVERPVKTIAIFLTADKEIRELETVSRCELAGELISEFHYSKVLLPDEGWQTLLEKNFPALYPLVPFSKIPPGEEQLALSKAVQKIEEIPEKELQGEMVAILYLLGGFRYPEVIRKVIGGKLMLDLMQSKTYREAVESGKIEGKLEDLMKFLHRRFGEIPEKLQEQLQKIVSIEKLDTLLDCAFTCVSLDEFQAQVK